MVRLTKTLTASLGASLCIAVNGVNHCLASCFPFFPTLLIRECGITDEDIPDIKTCFDTVGRSIIGYIDLSENDLTTIPADLFESLGAVSTLNLAGNKLSTLDEDLFQPMASSLGSLSLNNNELASLPSNVFDNLGALATLDLHSNFLTTLPGDLFDDLGSNGALTTLDLSDNPGLQCIPAVTFSDPSLSVTATLADPNSVCECTSATAVTCAEGQTCEPGAEGYTCSACDPGTSMCGDPHMQGLRGQQIDWSGIDNNWYCMVSDDTHSINVNVRLNAPLPQEFPDRQLITGLSVMSQGHSLVIEVTNPYDVNTDGCPSDMSTCLSNGGLRAMVDGEEVDDLLRFSRDEHVTDGIAVSASNLPVECRQFGGDKIWARMYGEMLQGQRQLTVEESFEDWILRFDHMAAPDWCAQYVAQNHLADVQSIYSVFKIVTSSVTVRLNVGTNFQGNGERDWDGRVLPDLEFWQMDVGIDGLSLDSESLTGILGETARPVLDKDGRKVMQGYRAIRGTVEDYRVSSALSTDFALATNKQDNFT
eukprot:jgi/Undpi1/7003/HiC_scaffold_21.g09477.m1